MEMINPVETKLKGECKYTLVTRSKTDVVNHVADPILMIQGPPLGIK